MRKKIERWTRSGLTIDAIKLIFVDVKFKACHHKHKRIPKDGRINSIAFELISELIAVDYIVDANKLLA